jgi:glycosyltransferase involved in cell wall biosynthesis
MLLPEDFCMNGSAPLQPFPNALPDLGLIEPLPVTAARATAAEDDIASVQLFLPGLDADERRAVEDAVAVLGSEVVEQVGGFVLPADFRLSVVIPVFNECDTIREILQRVQDVPIPKEILVVDDYSTDGTRDFLEQLVGISNLRVFLHPKNMGKGAALRTGFAEARGDVVVVQDADLEYNPAEFVGLLKPILEDRADVVYGSRFLEHQPTRQMWLHRVANGILTWLSNRFTRLQLTDMETCYKVFRRSVLDDIRIEQDRFGVEPELTAKIARRKHRVIEVPIAYDGRDYSEGKKIGLKDAFNALYCIVRYSLAD